MGVAAVVGAVGGYIWRGDILTAAGFAVEACRYRDIGGETFLWVTIAKP